jgi:ABC-type multidrug transport system fused ATPase/permease subunit
MLNSYKNNFVGYFKFYYQILGNKIIIYLFLSIVIGLLDGFGLSMFIPLIQSINTGGQQATNNDDGSFIQFITSGIEKAGLELNITTVLLLLISIFIFKGVMKFLQLTFYAHLKLVFLQKVRYRLLDNLQNLSYSGFAKIDAGRIQNTLTSEVLRLFLTMTNYFTTAQSFVMLSTYILLAFIANYQFAFLVCVGGALSNFIYKSLYKKTRKLSIQVSEKGSDFNNFLIQAVHYFKYLKSTNRFESYSKKLRSVIAQTEQLNKRIGYNKAVALSIKEPIVITIVCLVILLQVNWMNVQLSAIVLILLLFYRALTYLVAVQNDWQGFVENVGGIHTITSMSNEMAAMKEVTGDQTSLTIKKHIVFDNVSYNYGSKKALDKVSIEIPAKQTIALVGASGSGKTTIANMIAGLMKPDSGTIIIDNTPIQNLNLNSYRDKIGYIPQESVIFSDSIYNNITFWAEPTSANKTRFEEVLKLASLNEFIQSLPDKEHTFLGDNGILISGGQKQRISIARELFKKVEILVLDEATSALDSETEKVIQENIELLHGSFTIVLIAHRLSTIKEADIIYLLDNGKVAASGTFEEMIKKSSRFQKMVSLQAV